MRVKPAPGMTIVDPDRHDILPAEGRNVPETAYWRRRLNDGGIVLDASEQSSAPAAASPKGA
ncbi:DUF2635 domain-containing protein [Dongia soli]|uniref:DUF2635 domain-containing protein n=1 Tax=Dongia soli TaxID=600628 RepID=A0ABU5E9M6_9PROT|nr:DUF2635 domain-containing protein [Dongia soli]MDY0882305.1 DUF2635 domain-containing protein [Dongia soli]